tara:strand:- start:396 stop:500 length:105 start_codon:yes stop_codon:yes gene_type:complete
MERFLINGLNLLFVDKNPGSINAKTAIKNIADII